MTLKHTKYPQMTLKHSKYPLYQTTDCKSNNADSIFSGPLNGTVLHISVKHCNAASSRNRTNGVHIQAAWWWGAYIFNCLNTKYNNKWETKKGRGYHREKNLDIFLASLGQWNYSDRPLRVHESLFIIKMAYSHISKTLYQIYRGFISNHI